MMDHEYSAEQEKILRERTAMKEKLREMLIEINGNDMNEEVKFLLKRL